MIHILSPVLHKQYDIDNIIVHIIRAIRYIGGHFKSFVDQILILSVKNWLILGHF